MSRGSAGQRTKGHLRFLTLSSVMPRDKGFGVLHRSLFITKDSPQDLISQVFVVTFAPPARAQHRP
jgi:hypothetical protein